jgi:hypothetical protein
MISLRLDDCYLFQRNYINNNMMYIDLFLKINIHIYFFFVKHKYFCVVCYIKNYFIFIIHLFLSHLY